MADPHLTTRRLFIKTSAKAAAALTTAIILPTTGCSPTGSSHEYDTIIKNGTIYDGSLADPVTGDIGIKNDVIKKVGKIEGNAVQIIDAAGMMITPGFIDVHTHCDLTFEKSGIKRHLARFMPSWKGNHNYLYQGVTTVITGNCGWGYTDTDRWLSMVDDLGFGTNVGHLAPHGILREEVLKGGDPNIRLLSSAQMDRLTGRVKDEMDKGAFGLSAGLEYAPGLFAPFKELDTLCQAIEKQNRIFTVHMRDESGAPGPSGNPAVLDSISEAVHLADKTGINLEISHFKISSPFNGLTAEQIVEPVAEARHRGLSIHADQYPYDAGSTVLSYLVPHEMKKGAGLKNEYKNAAGRARIKEAIETTFTHLSPEKILITMNDSDDGLEGKTIMDISELKGRAPSDIFVELVIQDTPPMAVFFAQDMNVVRSLMHQDFLITASDGWTVPKDMTQPHPRTYGTFPRKLKQFAMTENCLDLKTALYSMTGLPGEKFKIQKRGRILPGYYADILVIDPAGLKDHSTYASPHQYAGGISHLFINGVHGIRDGVHTPERGGRALRFQA